MGLVLPQTIKIKAHNFTRKYYVLKGYDVGKIGEEFEVNVLDLQMSSTCRVSVRCALS